MKRLCTSVALAASLFAACQTARSQGGPQVITVPPDEMTRPPSLGPATTARPAASPPAYASVEKPAPTQAAAPKLSYNSCNVKGPYIAITFDDGPHATLTPKLLDMLKERNIKATFFMVGQCVVQYPDIVKRMVAEGHEVANHSWSHPALTKLGVDGVFKQIENTNKAIEDACGVRPVLMRPPYGATSVLLNKRYNDQFGLKVILWSVDPLDWKHRNADRVASQIIQGTQPGAIILAHDIHPSTVAAMPRVFDTLLAKGYKFVTVSELLALDEPPQLVKQDAATGPLPAASPAPAASPKKSNRQAQ